VKFSDKRVRLATLFFGSIALLAAIAFPFAPVHADRINYSWPGQGQAVALPLMPYQPVSLDATIPCAAASSLAGDGVLLSTVPLRTDPAAPALAGLQVSVNHGVAQLVSAGQDLAGGAGIGVLWDAEIAGLRP